MNKVKIKMSIDVDDVAQVEALNTLVRIIRETREENAAAPSGQNTTAATARTRTKKEAPKVEDIKVVDPETIEEAPAEDNLMGDAPMAVVATTLEDVRAAAEPKINAHRDAIKKKLAEYGAQNIGTVDPAHYGMFKTFLDSLS